MATGEFFDIVVRAKSMVSQGFQQAIAESKAAAAALNSASLGGVGGSFGKLGLTVEGVKGALRLAGAAAQAFKGDMQGVDAALSRLPMGMGEVYQAARDLAAVLFEVDKMAAWATQIERWEKLSATLGDVSRQAQNIGLRLELRNDFARQRVDAQDRIRDQINKIKADLKKEIEGAGNITVGEADPTTLVPEQFAEFQAVLRAKQAIGDLERQQKKELAAIGEAELRDVAAKFNARNEKAKQIEERERAARRAAAEESERYQEDIARMRAENTEQQLRAAGKLLEADRARNAEQARAALARARGDEERGLILERQRLADEAALANDKKRQAAETRKTDGKSAGFDLIEITSRVSGFAALQKSGWEAALDKHGGRMERALAAVKWECGEMVRAVKQKRMDGIGLAF